MSITALRPCLLICFYAMEHLRGKQCEDNFDHDPNIQLRGIPFTLNKSPILNSLTSYFCVKCECKLWGFASR